MSIQRYFMELSFLGTNYHGWQIQPNAQTVQSVLEEALSLGLREEVSLTGAGRTDTGVHARYFTAHFDSMHSDLHLQPYWTYRLNGILPEDISIHRILPVFPDAHARFSALSRTYEYYISREKDPFLTKQAWPYHGPLDIEKMKIATSLLFNHRDFKAFSRSHTQVQHFLCTILRAEWTEEKHLLVFRITANRFLRNMVRALTGTLVDVGRGKTSLDEWDRILRSGDRKLAGPSAPAKGLYLTEIKYPPELFSYVPDKTLPAPEKNDP